jgi:F-type H+-transporting ATPase subunit b
MRGWLVLLALVFAALSPAPAWAKKDDPAESKKDEGKEEKEAAQDVFKGWVDLTVYSIVVFLGLLFILSRFAWPKMLQGLEKRERDIAAAIEEAKKAKDEASRLLASIQKEKEKLQAEVNDIMARARADGDRLKAQREGEGEALLAAERERFEREKTTAHDQALHDILTQTAELAALVSSKVIRRQLTAEDHRALVDEALNELQQAAAQRHRGDGSAT